MTDDRASIADVADLRFREMRDANYRRTDRLFGYLMAGQLLFGAFLAIVISPYSWSGPDKHVHPHVWIALGLGGLITAMPLALITLQPGQAITRNVVAVSQMMWSALLIHLTGGRIETHFHVFGSLAFLAFYRDWRVLIPATIVIASDHFLRQQFWPESVFGLSNPAWWRFLEHAGWVVFEDIILITSCIVSMREMKEVGLRRAESDAAQAQLLRTEKLAAVGQLAASVGHELRNPLTAVRTAATYVGKRVKDGQFSDPKIPQFMGVIDRELGACSKIISDLLDFARERQLDLAPCPLRNLVDDAFALVPPRPNVELVNEFPEDLPVPSLDKDQFRQVVANLVQNAGEAMPDTGGRVVVSGARHGSDRIRLTIADNGPGMAPDTLSRIFEPLFTTKTKGTGLGLAIVYNIVRRHGAEIGVESDLGRGTTFHVDISTSAQHAKAA